MVVVAPSHAAATWPAPVLRFFMVTWAQLSRPETWISRGFENFVCGSKLKVGVLMVPRCGRLPRFIRAHKSERDFEFVRQDLAIYLEPSARLFAVEVAASANQI